MGMAEMETDEGFLLLSLPLLFGMKKLYHKKLYHEKLHKNLLILSSSEGSL